MFILFYLCFYYVYLTLICLCLGKVGRVMKAKTPKSSWVDVLKKGLAGKDGFLSRSQKARVMLGRTHTLSKPTHLTRRTRKAKVCVCVCVWGGGEGCLCVW